METRRRYLARNAHAGPRQQTGAVYAPAVAAVPWLFLAVVLLLGWAVLAITLAFARHTRGAVRWIGLIALTALWVVPLWTGYAKLTAQWAQKDAETAARLKAEDRCKQDLTQLPERIETRGLYDTGPGILMNAWGHFLGQEDLGFLEMHAADWKGKGGLPVHADDSGNGHGWALNQEPGTLVRIALSHDGDSACVPENQKAYKWIRDKLAQFRLPPFLPDTCIAMTFPAKLEAQTALSLSSAGSTASDMDQWQLVERASGRILGSLASSEWSNKGFVSDWRGKFSGSDPYIRNDCRAPRNVLASRLVHSPAVPMSPQLVRMQTTPVLVEPDAVVVTKGVRAALRSQTVSSYELAEADADPERLQTWQVAVETAKQYGHAGYGAWRLDWAERRMERLSFAADQTTHGIWMFQAVADGYYMWSLWDSDRRAPILAHYARNGALDWAVHLESVAEPESADCRWHNPKLLSFSATEMMLTGVGWCGPDHNDRRQLTWHVARRDLPH